MKRSKLILGIVIILMLSQLVNGQNRVGIIGGLNSASMELKINAETPDISKKSLIGIGGIVDFKLSEGLYLSLEPMYLKKGADAVSVDQPGVTFILKLSYLEIPVLLKKEFGNKLKPYIAVGPVLGYNLNADVEVELSGIVLKGDMKNIIKPFDFGLAFGGGLSYPVGKSSIFIECKYTIGLSNIEKGGSVEISSGPLSETLTTDPSDKTKNKGLQVMVGVTFPFGGN
ncbi:porin family protein [candidate division KSB1 bacterium]